VALSRGPEALAEEEPISPEIAAQTKPATDTARLPN
jgi:hypothetical protein